MAIELELAQPGVRPVAVNDELRKQLQEARTELVNQGLLIRKLQRATRSAPPPDGSR